MSLKIYAVFMFLIKSCLPVLRFIPNKKMRYYFLHQGELFKKPKSPLALRPLWIHASSGEIEYARSLIRLVREKHPHIPVMITHSSLSSRASLEKLDVELAGVIPLDEASCVQNFIHLTQPRALLVARTDIWPTLLSELKKQNIPSYLFSATFASGSKKMQGLGLSVLRIALKNFKKIYFVSSADEKLAHSHFPDLNGQIMGDTRYDQVVYRLENSVPISIARHPQIFVLGSTWPEDETVLIPVAAQMQKQNWKFLWVPHEIHPQALAHLKKKLEKLNLQVAVLSEGVTNDLWQKNDVLLVDQIGVLASLYKLAYVAFVGGSFRKQVHSVMEALATGSPVIVGPYHTNNREALEFQELGAVKVAHNKAEMISCLEASAQNRARLSLQLYEEIQKRLGVTQKILQDLESEGLFQESVKTESQTN